MGSPWFQREDMIGLCECLGAGEEMKPAPWGGARSTPGLYTTAGCLARSPYLWEQHGNVGVRPFQALPTSPKAKAASNTGT